MTYASLFGLGVAISTVSGDSDAEVEPIQDGLDTPDLLDAELLDRIDLEVVS